MENNDEEQRRRRRRQIQPVRPDTPFDFNEMMAQLALVERAARAQERRMLTMAAETAERREELIYMSQMIPAMIRTLDRMRTSHDLDLVEQAISFQTVIDDLGEKLSLMGTQTNFTMRSAHDLAVAFDRATFEYELLNGQLRAAAADTNLFDYRQRQEREEEEERTADTNGFTTPAPADDEATNRPAIATDGPGGAIRERVISDESRVLIDQWLNGRSQQNVILRPHLDTLNRAELLAIASHYEIVLRTAQLRSGDGALRTAISQRLLALRRTRRAGR